MRHVGLSSPAGNKPWLPWAVANAAGDDVSEREIRVSAAATRASGGTRAGSTGAGSTGADSTGAGSTGAGSTGAGSTGAGSTRTGSTRTGSTEGSDSLILARTKAELAAVRGGLGRPVVLVPTMGALHEGHRALLRRARQMSAPGGSVVVSVFVNPLQFGAGEDFGRYPRSEERDLAVCAQEGAAVVFAPARDEMYPEEPLVTVDPGPVGRLLEGSSRPGFFTGVLTVVLKLFQAVAPDVAVFGQKDAQQLALVRRMAADLDLGVHIEAVPIVRDPDGLAVSSRNVYLSPQERSTALALSRALRAAGAKAGSGADAVLATARAVLGNAAAAQPPLVLDYLALVDPATFTAVGDDHDGPALLLVAARVGATRLIDNAQVMLAGQDPAGGHRCC
jgi:pantoate--beta-alanine ligase